MVVRRNPEFPALFKLGVPSGSLFVPFNLALQGGLLHWTGFNEQTVSLRVALSRNVLGRARFATDMVVSASHALPSSRAIKDTMAR